MTVFNAYTRAAPPAPKQEPIKLPPLRFPVADPQRGIIKIADLVNDLVAFVPKSSGLKKDDNIILNWNGENVGELRTITQADLDNPELLEFEMTFPKAAFPVVGTDITGPFTYRLWDPDAENGQFAESPLTVRFDQLAPGGDQLPPLVFTGDQLEGITVADVIDGVLPLKVDPFFDSESDDVVELWLGTSETVGAYLSPTFSVTDPKLQLAVTIAETALLADPDGIKYFGYRATDFAGNVSDLSELTPLPVFLKLPTLPAPVVPEYEDTKLITYNDAVPDVGVQIPKYDGAAIGDLIYVVWGGVRVPPFELTDVSNDPLVTLLVPYETVQSVGDGDAITVNYELQRTDTPRVTSDSTVVKVNLATPGGPDPDPTPETPEHDNIKAPDVQCGTSPANSIQPGDYGKPATAMIHRVGVDLNPIWLAGDIIQLQWGKVGAPAIPPLTVTAGNAGTDIPIPVPFDEVIGAEGVGDINVFFTLTRALDADNNVTVQSPVRVVKVVSNAALPGDGKPLVKGLFPEANARNIITHDAGINGTTFRIPLAGVTNIEPDKSPTIEYNFVGVESGSADVPGAAPPIEQSRKTETNIPVTQAMIDAGFYEVPLPYSLTYYICRNGALLDYSISNTLGKTNAEQSFVRFAMNLAGTGCELP